MFKLSKLCKEKKLKAWKDDLKYMSGNQFVFANKKR